VPVLIKQSRDGTTREWDVTPGELLGAWTGIASLATDGRGTLYALKEEGYVTPFDTETGKARAETGSPEARTTWDPVPDAVQREKTAYRHSRGDAAPPRGLAAADLAAHGDTIVVSFQQRDTVRWLGEADGSIEAEVQVPAPLGVAVGPDEQVYVISRKRVLRVGRSGEREVVVKESLASPRRLDVDPASGDLLVAEGRGDWRVKRFGNNGRLMRTYGRKGGRKSGPYEPQHFLAITDITADGEGGFFVVENDGPRRVAHLDREGNVLSEWFGGLEWTPWLEPDPRHVNSVWYPAPGRLVRAHVDYEHGDWRIEEVHDVDEMAGGLAFPADKNRRGLRIFYHEGQRYVGVVRNKAIEVFRHREGRLKPVSVTAMSHKKGVEGLFARALELADHAKDAERFQWIDRSGDGWPQPDEFAFSEETIRTRRTHFTSAGSLINFGVTDERLRPVLGNAHATEPGDEVIPRVERYAVSWKDGIPRYHVADRTHVARTTREGRLPMRTHHNDGGAFRSADGSSFAYYLGRHDSHPFYWPARGTSIFRLVKWGPDGELRWKVGRAASYGRPKTRSTRLRVGADRAGLPSSPDVRPTGHVQYPTGIAGETEKAIVLGDRIGTLNKVWTKDGLYAGQLLDRRSEDGLPDFVYS
jgi:hypothetical protein